MSRGYIGAKEKPKALYDRYLDDSDTELPTGHPRRGPEYRGVRTSQVQNAKSARVYVFGQNEIYETSEAEMEMTQIRPRKGGRNNCENQPESDTIFFERQVTEEDSLTSIALQYGCTVAELKRINNLMKDQDIYGRPSIKVPIKRYGLLTELLEEEQKQNNSDSSGSRLSGADVKHKPKANGSLGLERTDYQANDLEAESDTDLSDPELQTLLMRKIGIGSIINSQSEEAEQFLSNMDKDLHKIRNSANSYKSSLHDVTSTLIEKRIQPLRKKSYLMDCNYRHIVAVAITFAIVIPLIVIYLYCSRYDCHLT